MTIKEKIPFKKPPWLRKKLSKSAQQEMEKLLDDAKLYTICQEAKCPNISECFSKKNATFLILGNICTRRCTYCNVQTGMPKGIIDEHEIKNVSYSVKKLGLKYVVITSPARDDLEDGGSGHFYNVTQNIIKTLPDTKVELLIPDFKNQLESLQKVIDSGAHVIGHNIETVPRLYHIRRNSNYKRALSVLGNLSKLGKEKIKTKSGLMVGLGESENEVIRVLQDLSEVGCKFLSIGQYLAPSKQYSKVQQYITPEQFARYKEIALDFGFEYVLSSPYARSSYLAHEYIQS